MKALTKGQRERVLGIARKDERLKPLVGAKGKVLFVEPHLTGRSAEHLKRAVVGLHDGESGRSVIAVVDPDAKEVVGVEELPAQLQLSSEERDEASGLASKDRRVRDFLGGRKLNPLTRLYFPPAGDESHRYAIVFVRPDNAERRYAVVDLTEQKVVDVLSELAAAGPHRV